MTVRLVAAPAPSGGSVLGTASAAASSRRPASTPPPSAFTVKVKQARQVAKSKAAKDVAKAGAR